jgi:hypothetical protein
MSPILVHPETGQKVKASAAGAHVLRSRGYTDAGRTAGSKSAVAPDSTEVPLIESMTSKELDERARALGIADWNAKAKLAEKRASLAEFFAPPIVIVLEQASDAQLRDLAEENDIDFDDDTSREDLIFALRASK